MNKKPEILELNALASESRIFRIEQARLRFSNGVERDYERLRPAKRGAVMVVAMPDDESFLLVREYCFGVENYELGLPKGLIEENESIEDAANRELMEEAGFGARDLQVIKNLSLAPAYFAHQMHVVLARDLYVKKLPGDEPEDIEVVPWQFNKLDELFNKQNVSEARSIAAIYLIKEYLNNSD